MFWCFGDAENYLTCWKEAPNNWKAGTACINRLSRFVTYYIIRFRARLKICFLELFPYLLRGTHPFIKNDWGAFSNQLMILLTNTMTWPSSERNIEIRTNIRAFHLELYLCQLIDNGADNHSGVWVRAHD